MMAGWRDVGFDTSGSLRIERNEWAILRIANGLPPSYALWRGRELQGIFPSAHEAAMHADLTEAGQV